MTQSSEIEDDGEPTPPSAVPGEEAGPEPGSASPDGSGRQEAPSDVFTVELDFAGDDRREAANAKSVDVPEPSEPFDDDPLAGPSNLEEARDTGDTGKTGETLFVAQGAFARPDAGVGSDAGEEEFLPPRTDLRRLMTRVLPVLLLVGVIFFSYSKLAEINARSTATVTNAESRDQAAPPPASTDETLADAVDEPIREVELPPLPSRGVAVSAILGHEVEWVQPESDVLSFTRLDSGVIEPQRVTVLNLWATWCKPCKSELPDLKAMFKKSEWGERVRFASILSQDGKSPHSAYRDFAAKMPSADYFLAEMSSSDTAITEALRKKGRIQEGGLPVTVVLDCRREVRFAHQGRLTPKNFEELRGMIDSLVGELGTDFCVEKRKKSTGTTQQSTGSGAAKEAVEEPVPEFIHHPEPPAVVEPASTSSRQAAVSKPKSVCGDKACTGSESCFSCPADCGCPSNNECRKNSAGLYACLYSTNALKED